MDSGAQVASGDRSGVVRGGAGLEWGTTSRWRSNLYFSMSVQRIRHELFKLSAAERLRLAQDLWDSVAG